MCAVKHVKVSLDFLQQHLLVCAHFCVYLRMFISYEFYEIYLVEKGVTVQLNGFLTIETF